MLEAEEVVQPLRLDTALVEDPGLIPSTHTEWLKTSVTPAPWVQTRSSGLCTQMHIHGETRTCK